MSHTPNHMYNMLAKVKLVDLSNIIVYVNSILNCM